MSRDAENRAKSANDQAMSLSKDYGAKADSLGGQLSTLYNGMATNPSGMSQGDLNDANTASMQSSGGGVAAAKGEGYLDAARTGNVGGYQSALRDAAQKGIATDSNNALKVKLANSTLKEAQRDQGIGGLQGLQSSAQQTAVGALNPAVGAVNAQTEAGKSGWFQNMTGLINAVSGAGQSAASLGFGK